VGSISKLFTATAAMQLAEQGKLDIDRPLQTYLPEFSIKTRFPDAGPITLTALGGLLGSALAEPDHSLEGSLFHVCVCEP